jgi:hypothetical protein
MNGNELRRVQIPVVARTAKAKQFDPAIARAEIR